MRSDMFSRNSEKAEIFKGGLVITLDFELLWGVFDKVDINQKKNYFLNTRKVVPQILDLFQEFDVHATWATVGMLFNKDWNEWSENKPNHIANYTNEKLDPYTFGNLVRNLESDLYCFAPDLIDRITTSSGQELGTHTYSHYYCKEQGQTKEMFKADLKIALELASKKNISLKSIVFPRNQFNDDYLQICIDLGIKNFRINPDSWYWKDPETNSFVQKVFRTGDAYAGLNNKSYKLQEIYHENCDITLQKSSRMLRPYSGNKILEKLKIDRIKSEISSAARKKEIYHLWWHPHNFGNNTVENLIQLREVLEHFEKCKKKYDFGSYTMDELRLLNH